MAAKAARLPLPGGDRCRRVTMRISYNTAGRSNTAPCSQWHESGLADRLVGRRRARLPRLGGEDMVAVGTPVHDVPSHDGRPHVRGGRPATLAHGTDLGGRCPLRRLRRRYPCRRSVARALRLGKCDARSNVGDPLKVSDAALTKNGPAAARPFSEESRSGGSPGRKPPRPRRRRRAAEAAPGHPPPETASLSC
jgi:hypothetical protein